MQKPVVIGTYIRLNVHYCIECKAHDPDPAFPDIPEMKYWWWCPIVEDIVNGTMGCDEYWKHRKTLKERILELE